MPWCLVLQASRHCALSSNISNCLLSALADQNPFLFLVHLGGALSGTKASLSTLVRTRGQLAQICMPASPKQHLQGKEICRPTRRLLYGPLGLPAPACNEDGTQLPTASHEAVKPRGVVHSAGGLKVLRGLLNSELLLNPMSFSKDPHAIPYGPLACKEL